MDGSDVTAGLGKALAALVAVPVVALLLLLAINSRDEAPSADAARLAAMLRERPALADAANGYVHARDLSAGHPGYRDARSPEVAALAAACPDAGACAAALESDAAAVGEWIAAERWLLERYRAMLATGGWREEIPADVADALPPYGDALEAQKLYLLAARERARAGDAAAVRDLLERDLGFWRRVMASSNLLVTKMAAGAAVERNFAFGHLALRALPAASAAQAVPPSWRRPLSVPERSLAGALAGEWHFSTSALRKAMDQDGGDPAAFAGLPASRLQRLVFKEQATANLFAARMAGLGRLSERPYAELAGALDVLARGGDERPWSVYNPVGAILAGIAAPAYGEYIVRVSDLEGRRRLALLVAELRAAGVSGDDAALALSATPLRNPYDDAPFEWDAQAGAVVFRGLREGERGRYAVPL